MTAAFVVLDWGTTSLRASLADRAGRALETRSAPDGILAIAGGDFDGAMERLIAGWDRSLPVVASGMITSKQGWIEVPYVECPAGTVELAAAARRHLSAEGRSMMFIGGARCRAATGMPDVMRGEETQVLGCPGGASSFVAPGTHSKWISMADGRIGSFATYMTGEVYALLRNHSILARLMTEESDSDEAFSAGVRAALADPAGLLHRIFAARTLALFNEMPVAALASFLSGQIIGTEIAHAARSIPASATHIVLASDALVGKYIRAMELAGLRAEPGPADAAVRGQASIMEAAGLLR
ncbi:MAG: 2-dehydro-3-deoxygalactonokinase [Alphaproteobacteria bacterium]|nr:2-dehydro-3-deoxygalactonokinase [Alphaproteobacteria bacterium]